MARSQAARVSNVIAACCFFAILLSRPAASRMIIGAPDETANLPATDSTSMQNAGLLGTILRQADGAFSQSQRDVEDSDVQLRSVSHLMDHMFSRAFLSMDHVSNGLLSDLTGPNVEFAKSSDGTQLIARVHMPSESRAVGGKPTPLKLHVSVLGRSHLRVKVDSQAPASTISTVHTLPLPVYVNSEVVAVTPNEDGTVHVLLRIEKEVEHGKVDGANDHQEKPDDPLNSFFERRIRNPLIPSLFRRESVEDSTTDREFTAELPTALEMSLCRDRYRNDELRRKQCLCEVTPSDSSRAICYGELVSKSLRIARRLRMDDFATSAKHRAIECADGHEPATTCLQRVASDLLTSVYNKPDSRNESENVEDRIREAIESEDDGPSGFRPSGSIIVSVLTILSVIAFCTLGVVFIGVKRIRAASRSRRVVTELSSTLSQTAREGAANSKNAGGNTVLQMGSAQSAHSSSSGRTREGCIPRAVQGKDA